MCLTTWHTTLNTFYTHCQLKTPVQSHVKVPLDSSGSSQQMLHSFVASERKLIAHGIQLKTLSDGAWRDGCEGILPIQLHWSRILIDWMVVDITRRSMCESLGGKVAANLLISDNPPSPTKKQESHIKELWGDAGWAPPPHTLNGVIAQSWSALCLARPLSRCNYPAVFRPCFLFIQLE